MFVSGTVCKITLQKRHESYLLNSFKWVCRYLCRASTVRHATVSWEWLLIGMSTIDDWLVFNAHLHVCSHRATHNMKTEKTYYKHEGNLTSS